METYMAGKVALYRGDCREVLSEYLAESFDSCVTDPPYHLTSIVKRFGATNAAPAKSDGPTGVYKRASSGFMGKQWDGGDVAFQKETWEAVYRVLKPGGHVLAFGATKNVGFLQVALAEAGFEIRDMIMWLYGTGFPKSHSAGNGWGTALKPACEPIVMARKPLIGTVAQNIAAHGTGAINIDGCRIEGAPNPASWTATRTAIDDAGGRIGQKAANIRAMNAGMIEPPSGRWPANVCHDGSDEVLELFPPSKGQQGDVRDTKPSSVTADIYGKFSGRIPSPARNDNGSAARFFYCAKASKDDRIGSKHPTVKPVSLLRWLVRLVTPKDGLVLDPFAGTGTTAEAALCEGMRSVLIELEEDSIADIRFRMDLMLAGPEERERLILRRRGELQPPDDLPLMRAAA